MVMDEMMLVITRHAMPCHASQCHFCHAPPLFSDTPSLRKEKKKPLLALLFRYREGEILAMKNTQQ